MEWPGDTQARSAALPERLNDADVLLGLAAIFLNHSRPAEALVSIERALQLRPDDAAAHYSRATVLLEHGRLDEAIQGFDQVLALDPEFAPALNNRGVALDRLGRSAEALDNYDRLLVLAPDHADALNNRGNALRALGRPAEALEASEAALAIRPGFASALNNRGVALCDLGRHAEGLESYDAALALEPNFAEALNNRGNALKELNRLEEALASLEAALGVRPGYAEALNNRGNVLKDLMRASDALASYEAALALAPSYAEAYDNKGVLLAQMGRFEEASEAVETAIRLEPGRVRAYYDLTEIRSLRPGEPYVEAMEALARHGEALAPEARIELEFALGKAYADLGQPEEAFRRFLAGNALKRARTAYDETAALQDLERIQQAFSEDLLRRRAGPGHPSAAPVFILGMPRSGTTLVEQILASHPEVFGAGEIDAFIEAAIEHAGDPDPLSGPALRRLGARYLAKTAPLAPGASRIVNKSIDNIRFAGLIHLALPDARLIQVRRDPLDVCVSCFTKLFVGQQNYAYDLGELGRYARAHAELMDHWSQVIPPEALLEVRYEDLVADLEGQARRLVAHCGLEWDDACLRFHLADRPVRTASAGQVRRPIYASSIGRWRLYEPFLGPLKRGLGLA